MPRVLSYTPPWLSRPSPGFELFQSQQTPDPSSKRDVGPSRTIAHRGTQIFVAVGNELRWSDLTILKNRADFQASKSHSDASAGATKTAFRVLKVPVSRPIKQLVVSPAGDYLAILTSHTIHIAVLPDASHLVSEDTSPLKIKTLHVGPTTHVLERSPLATALWHPLGNHGSCLVTVTRDAIVRAWELERNNRWSYDVPALAIDLKKLADGSSSAEDFSPSKYGANKGYSPDSFDMEVSSACFGGTGQENEMPWSPMTLWIAMRGGDVYALCPLLPSKWQTSPSLIANLSAHIFCDSSVLLLNQNATGGDQRVTEQQSTWLSEISTQQEGNDLDSLEETYHRPKRPSPIPMLQGPFQIPPDADEVFDITDIFVIPATEPANNPHDEDASSEDADERLAASIVCLATSDETIHVCLDLGGITGRWLPSKQSMQTPEEHHEHPEILLVESISLSESAPNPYWPQFTVSPESESCLFINHSRGISVLDLSSWTTKLADEVDALEEAGASFRVDLLVDSSAASTQHFIKLRSLDIESEETATQPSACIALLDADLGTFVLTQILGQPYSATLDNFRDESKRSGRLLEYAADNVEDIVPFESRPSYQASNDLWMDSTFTHFMDKHVHSRHRRAMSENVRMSPATLDLLMEAHRILSHETRQLGVAAADLFRRCERLQDEFKEQISRSNEIANRIDSVLDDDPDGYAADEEVVGIDTKLTQRLDAARSRSEQLTERYATIRQKLGQLNGKPLSDKELAWKTEVEAMDRTACSPEIALEESLEEVSPQHQLWQRFGKLRRMEEQLLEQWREHDSNHAHGDSNDVAATSGGASGEQLPTSPREKLVVSSEKKRARWNEISTLLERQSTLVESTKLKLDRLSLVSF